MSTTELGLRISAQTTGEAEVARLQAAVDKLFGRIDESSKKTKEIGKDADFSKFAEKIKAGISDPLGSIGTAAASAVTSLGPVGVAITGTVGALTAFAAVGFSAAKSLGEFGDRTGDTAIRLGMTTKEVGQFDFAMKRAGGSIEGVEGIMRKLSQALVEKPEEFSKLGLRVRELDGSFRPTSKIVLELSERLAAMPSAFERNAMAVKLMGRGALEALPDLLQLSEGVKRARDLDVGLTPTQVKKFEEYEAQIAELEHAWERLKRSAKEPIAAIFSVIVKRIDESRTKDVGQITTFDAIQNAALMFVGMGNAQGIQPNQRLTDIVGSRQAAAQAAFLESARAAAMPAMNPQLRGQIERDLNSTKYGLGQSLSAAQAKAADAFKAYAGYAGPDIREAAKLKADYDAAEIAATKLKNRIDAIAEAEARAKAEAGKFKSAMEGLTKRGEESWAGGDDLEKIIADYEHFLSAFKPRGKDLEQVNALFGEIFSNKHVEVSDKLADSWEKMTREAHALSEEMSKAGWKEVYSTLDKYGAAQVSAVLGMRQAGLSGRVGAAEAAARSDIQIAGLIAPSWGQRAVIDATAARQKQLALELYKIEQERIALETDAWKRKELEFQNEAKLKAANRDADLEHEARLLELQRNRIQQFRSNIVAGFDALISGGAGGMGALLKSFGIGQLRQIVGNTAEMAYKNIGSGLSLPGTGTDLNPTKLGALLSGTLFGPKSAIEERHTTAMEMHTFALMRASGVGAVAGMAGLPTMNAVGKWAGLLMPGIGGNAYTDLSQLPLPAFNPAYLPGAPAGTGNPMASIYGFSPSSTRGFTNQYGSKGVTGAAYGTALAAGAFGVYSGLRQGGAQGGLTVASSALGTAAVLDPEPISKAALMVAALATGIAASLFGDPKKKRGEAIDRYVEGARYNAPDTIAQESDLYGNLIDYSRSGQMRTYQPIVNVNITALDTKSIVDHYEAIGDAVYMAVNKNHPLVGEIQGALV